MAGYVLLPSKSNATGQDSEDSFTSDQLRNDHAAGGGSRAIFTCGLPSRAQRENEKKRNEIFAINWLRCSYGVLLFGKSDCSWGPS